jgi:hypothetical protein
MNWRSKRALSSPFQERSEHLRGLKVLGGDLKSRPALPGVISPDLPRRLGTSSSVRNAKQAFTPSVQSGKSRLLRDHRPTGRQVTAPSDR